MLLAPVMFAEGFALTPICFQRRISTCEPGLLEILSGQDELTVCTPVMSEASDTHTYAFSEGFLRINLFGWKFCRVRMN